MTGNRPFDNPSTQAERRAALENDKRVRASTYLDHVHDDLAGGRFAKEFPTSAVGSTPTPRYPDQPQNAPWADRMVDEQPLGYSVEEPPVVGEAFEVQASLDAQNDVRPSVELPSGEAGSGVPSSAVETASPHFSRRGKRR